MIELNEQTTKMHFAGYLEIAGYDRMVAWTIEQSEPFGERLP